MSLEHRPGITNPAQRGEVVKAIRECFLELPPKGLLKDAQ
jgi:hypothetical protein